MTDQSPALRLIEQGAAGLAPHVLKSGELNDPVFGEPTEYGTAYFAYVNATLSALGDEASRPARRDAARAGLAATLRHLADPADPTPAADFTHDIGSPGTRNLRDFMWPPALRALRLLRQADGAEVASVEALVRKVAVPDVFSERAPVNWAAVWIAGELLRMQDGLSPHPDGALDGWLEGFFAEDAHTDHGFYKELRLTTGASVTWRRAIDVAAGLYQEPGVPNSYDLWARLHLMDLLYSGYQGAYRGDLERLAVTGLRRSLDIQLSSGSLPSAYRGSGHLWNLAGQCSLFFHGARLVEGQEPDLAEEARQAALRAFVAAQACLRPSGDLSPIENVHPASVRMGYEAHTMDAHYVSLPLGFLCNAVLNGFTGAGQARERPDGGRAEGGPVHRSVVHTDGWSVHLNLNPQEGYDAFGIADVTLGLGRRLRFGGQTHYGRSDAHPDEHFLTHQTPVTLGVAARGADRQIRPLSAMRPTAAPEARYRPGHLEATAILGEIPYRITVDIDGDVVRIVEGAGHERCSLVIPYLYDRGDGVRTDVTIEGSTVELRSGDETIAVVVDGTVERAVHLASSYESRYGLCGLVRLDVAEPGPVAYELRRQR
jgi:hypothetical protein